MDFSNNSQPTNPYIFKGPLNPGKDKPVCISREKQIRKVVNGIQKGDYWAITGPKQVGKTTFLRQIEAYYPHAHYLYIDFEINDCEHEHFYSQLIREFINAIPAQERDTGQWAQSSSPEMGFLHFLENFKPQEDNKPIILLFDEIEKINSLGNFLHLWRKVYHERYHKRALRRYRVVSAGSMGLVSATIGPNSPYNIAETCEIKDFPEEDAAQLIGIPMAALGITIDPEVKTLLTARTGGHPQLLQHLCSLLADQALDNDNDRHIRPNHLENAVHTLFNSNTVLELLKENIRINNILEDLLRDILAGAKRQYFPNKDYAFAGAGAIVENENSCAVIPSLKNLSGASFKTANTKHCRHWNGTC